MASMFEENLTEPTVEGKVRQLLEVLISVPFDSTSAEFNWREGLDEDRVGYVSTMLAEALTTYFNVPTEPEDLENLSTVQDIVNRINNGSA